MSVADTSGSGSAAGGSSIFGKIGSAGTAAGGAVSDIFAAEGDLAESKQYQLAAGMAGANEEYAALMTKVKETQQQRELYQTIGAQQTGFAGGNIAESGSALDVLRSSVQQGSLQQYIINEQGAAQESAYREQQQAYQTMASTAQNAASGAYIGAAIKGATAIAALL